MQCDKMVFFNRRPHDSVSRGEFETGNLNYLNIMDKPPSNFAAVAVDELNGTLSNRSEVADSGFLVNVAKSMNSGFDAFGYVPHQGL